jgi:hypothetical protein
MLINQPVQNKPKKAEKVNQSSIDDSKNIMNALLEEYDNMDILPNQAR